MLDQTEVSSSSVAPAKKHVKRYKPKVRSGCKTCKKRKVKCDEARPGCTRCAKINVECPGYGLWDASKASAHNLNFVKLSALKPSLSIQEKSGKSGKSLIPRLGTASGSIKPKLSLDILSHELNFGSETEQRYFRVFRDESGPELSGWNSLTWDRLMMQASHNEPFVRHGIVAISALIKAYKPSTAGITRLDEAESRCHQDFALKQYGRSIKLMREALATDQGSALRNALLACLLVFSFEGMMGHQDLALQHAQFGVELLNNWLNRTAITPLAAAGILSPYPALVEDELVHAVGLLDVQIMNLVDARASSVHRVHMHSGAEALKLMPMTFTDLSEARAYLEIIIRRTGHFIRVVAGSSPRYSGATKVVFRDLKDPLVSSETEIPIVSEELRELHGMFVDELKRWRSAANGMIEDIISDLSRPHRIRASALLMCLYTLTTDVFLGTIFSPRESAYHDFKPHFREMIVLIQKVEETICRPRERENYSFGRNEKLDLKEIPYSFDISITRALYAVCKRCRSPSLRRAAISILESRPYHGGWWDSTRSVPVAEMVMCFEEAGTMALAKGDPLPTKVPSTRSAVPIMVGGRFNRGNDNHVSVEEWLRRSDEPEMHIPEEAMITVTGLKFEEHARHTKVSCLRGACREKLHFYAPWR